MTKLIIDLGLDGYETDEEHDAACHEFIEEMLNMSASSIKILNQISDETYEKIRKEI